MRQWTDEEFHSTRHYASLTDALEFFKNDPLVFEPGTRTLYTSLGYNLLGAAVENASGQDFLDYMRENVFTPAGMETAGLDDVFSLIPHRAQGYQKAAGGELLNSALSDTSNRVPGGGLAAFGYIQRRMGLSEVVAGWPGNRWYSRLAGWDAPRASREGSKISVPSPVLIRPLSCILLEYGVSQ